MKLKESFYQHNDVAEIARLLLGKVLLSNIKGKRTSGIIVETEAYSWREKGCHAYDKKRTERNKVMFEAGGISYVYLCYGIHNLFNVVTNRPGNADAVLIRALQPLEGTAIMTKRMKASGLSRITSGPGKLSKALGIDRRHNGINLRGNEIWIEDQDINFAPAEIRSTPRIGIDYAGEDALLPWRFVVHENKWVSK